MDQSRAHLIDQSRRIVEALFAHHASLGAASARIAVLLSGSAASGFADDHSGIDLVVLVPDDRWEEVAGGIVGGEAPAPGQVLPLAPSGSRAKVSLWPAGEVRRFLERWDDVALYALSNARVLHDPAGLAGPLQEIARRVPDEVWQGKAVDAYRRFRQRKASLAWSLRRGQPFVCLDNLVQLLTAALSLCYYLEGKAPANRKWLFRGALRTAAGQSLRPALFELLSSLGEIALLGGSFNLRHNHLYGLLGGIQSRLEAELRRRGWDAAGHPRSEAARPAVRSAL